MKEKTTQIHMQGPSRESLDPGDFALDEFAGRILPLVEEYFSGIREMSIFPGTDGLDGLSAIDRDIPHKGSSVEEIVEDCRILLNASRQNGHPRFFGYVASPSTIPGAFADFFASAINQNVTSWRSAPAATLVEKLVISWLGELTGFGYKTEGILTSGGSMANFNALLMAHRANCNFDAGLEGLGGPHPPATVYVSGQVHHSIIKAADLAGIGRTNVRVVNIDDRFRMDPRSLAEAIKADKETGARPFCVVASAGTVNTGSVDPLCDIAAIAKQHGLWFHVDGAYGAPATLDPSKRALFDGIELADSMSIDAHKWLYSPVDCGCLLFRDPSAARKAFSESSEAEYIKVYEGEADQAYAFWDHGIELSRRFRALKLWMMLRYFGVSRVAKSIADDNRMAAYMGRCVEESEDLELLAPVELSVCCFRYVPVDLRNPSGGTGDESVNLRLNELNAAIMFAIQRGGKAYLSNAMLGSRYALRACIVNFRTTTADIDQTLDLVRQTAAELK